MFILLWIDENNRDMYNLFRGGDNNLRVQLDSATYYFEPYPKELIQDEKYKDYNIYYSKLVYNKSDNVNNKKLDFNNEKIIKIFLK